MLQGERKNNNNNMRKLDKAKDTCETVIVVETLIEKRVQISQRRNKKNLVSKKTFLIYKKQSIALYSNNTSVKIQPPFKKKRKKTKKNENKRQPLV